MPMFDSLTAFTSGFGGDPDNFAKLNFYKGKLYEFSGIFRRDRQYFDYDLLGNPNILSGLSTPIGPTGAPTGSLAVAAGEPIAVHVQHRAPHDGHQPHPFSALDR